MVTVENHIGKISVSDKYLIEIVKHAVADCFGVAGVCSTTAFRSALSAMTHERAFRKNRGVKIRTDKEGGLIIDLHIRMTYGTNITAAVDSIIHKVTFSVVEASGVEVHKVNVYVDDMSA